MTSQITALIQRIRSAMVVQEYGLVQDLMVELTGLLGHWNCASPPPSEVLEISRQCMELQSEIVRQSAQVRDALRYSIETSTARRAYAISGVAESRTLTKYLNGKE